MSLVQRTLFRKTHFPRRRILILCAIFLTIFFVTLLYKFVGNDIQYHLEFVAPVGSKVNAVNFPFIWQKKSEKYLVNTDTCKILDLDPFDPSVKKFLEEGHPMKCRIPLVSVINETLRIIEEVARRNWQCCYRTIERVTQSLTSYNRNADWLVSISNECQRIDGSNGTRVDTPYIKIECQNESKLKLEVQFEAIIVPPDKLSNKTKKWDDLRKRNSENAIPPPSVLIIGIDSVSRLHMYRQLPKTKKYLEENEFVEMSGYTKVGENTFPNIMAAIGGMEAFKWPCWKNREDKLDDCPLLWKNFSDNGYITALVEDAPESAIFNYRKIGFVKQPTDYYLRPLIATAYIHEKGDKISGVKSCFGGVNPTEYMLNYINRFLYHTGNRYPHFLLSWFTTIGHDDINRLMTADLSFQNFFKDVLEKEENGGNNTLILFISDHGYRFGSFRETFLGFYEVNLPFFYVRIPPTLKKRFPNWVSMLKENKNRLTSPLDLYETLKDILDLSQVNGTTGLVKNEIKNDESDTETIFDLPRDPNFRKRYSLFEKIPKNRTCENSAIPQSYCMCGVTPEVGKNSNKTIQLAKFVIKELNTKQLESVISKDQCHVLKFSEVLYGRQLSPGEVWNNFGKLEKFQDYIVAFEANPGKGHFEARVRVFQNGTQGILDSVSRINSYSSQADCMEDYVLKNYSKQKIVIFNKQLMVGRLEFL